MHLARAQIENFLQEIYRATGLDLAQGGDEKLSSTQTEPYQANNSAVAWLPLISGATSCPITLYHTTEKQKKHGNNLMAGDQRRSVVV